MYIVQHAHPIGCRGERATAAAGRQHGLRSFELWLGTLDAGERGAICRHAGELVVLALAGAGKLIVDGGPQRFIAPCSLLVPPGLEFQVINNGTATLQLVWAYTQTPEPAGPLPA